MNDRTDIGGNNPPTDEHAMTERLRETHPELVKRHGDLMASFGRMPELVEDQDTANKAADFVKMLNGYVKTAEAARKVAKEPYYRGGQIVDRYFGGELIEPVKVVLSRCKERLSDYQRRTAEAERKAREEAERKAREEAERARREAEEKARKEREAALEAQREAERKAREAQTEEDMERAIEAEAEAERRRKAAAAEAERRAEEQRVADARAAARAREASETNAALSRQRSLAGSTASLRTTIAMHRAGTAPRSIWSRFVRTCPESRDRLRDPRLHPRGRDGVGRRDDRAGGEDGRPMTPEEDRKTIEDFLMWAEGKNRFGEEPPSDLKVVEALARTILRLTPGYGVPQ